jgi:uncharacterized protein YceK
MRSIKSLALAAVVALGLSGCNSIRATYTDSVPFAGVQHDFAVLGTGPGESVFAIFDVPFSFVMDICWIPVTVPWGIYQGRCKYDMNWQSKPVGCGHSHNPNSY